MKLSSFLKLCQYFAGFAILLVCAFGITVFPVELSVPGILLAESFLAKISDDPQLWKKWDEQALKQGENKTEFSESEIGVTWGDDGPEPSDRVTTSPIVLKQDLTNGGKYMDIPYYNPLFTDPSDILNAGRYGEQDRIGAEEVMTRHNFRVLLDKWHLGVAEKEIEESVPNTAHMSPEKLMRLMLDRYTDNAAQKLDYGTFFAFFAGYDITHFTAAAERANAANGARPVADPQMGLMDRPFEHRRSYAYVQDGSDKKLIRVTYSSDVDTYENNIVSAISQITAATKPGLDFFRKINRICLREAMIPCRLRDPDGNTRDYFLVMLPGGARDLAEKDTEFKDVMNSAYQKMVDKHPLLRPGDILYKNLIIRDSTKLDKPYFSAKYSFNAISQALTDTTQMTFNRVTTNNIEKLSLTPGTRTFSEEGDYASAAAAAFGAVNTQVVKRCMVMGGAAIARATGRNFELKKLEITQYGLKDGIGKTKLFGQARNEKWTVGGLYDSTPQSFQVFVLGDEDVS